MIFARHLRAHGATFLVVVTALAAFTFSVIDDRNARHRAGITDACAREQAAERLFPITRCPTEDEAREYLARLGVAPLLPRMSDYFPEGDIPKDDPRYVDCEKLIAAERAGQSRTGPTEIFWILLGCDTEGGKDAEQQP